jgi:hypothetical protein
MGLIGNTQGQPRYSGELHNLQLTQSVFGTTATAVHGTDRVAGKLLFYGGFWATPAPNQGKGLGGGKSDTQYNYYADCQLLLASGSAGGGCRGILSIWDQQGKLANAGGAYVYTIPPGGGTINPQAAGAPSIQLDLGVSKSVAYSVIANDYASGGSRTLTGTQMVAMAKVTGTPAAGQYAFNSTTGAYTFAAADAGASVTISYSTVFSLYYFTTTQPAEVPLLSPYQISTNNQQYFWSDGGVIRVDTGAALAYGAGTNGYTQSDGVYTFTSDLAGVYVYITYTFTSSDSSLTNTSTLNLTFFGGSLGQAPNSYWQSQYPGSAFGYPGICHVDANPMALGESATLPCYNYEVVGLNIFPGGGLDAHFCDVFRTHLYDAFLGVGFPQANVDAWTSCYAYWAANGYLGKVKLDTQTSVATALKEVIETGNVGAVWSGGLLKLIPYGDSTCVGNGYTYTPNTTPVATLTNNDLLPSSEKKAGESSSEDPVPWEVRAPQDCWNYVQAQYCNRLNDYNNELINEQNDAFIARYGRRIESPQTWDWITTAAAAQWALNLRLKRQCYITNTCKLWLSYRFSYLEPMDIITLPTGENIRITQITDDANGRLAIEAEQWTYGSSTASIYSKQAPSSFQPSLSSALPGDAVPIVVQNTLALTPGSPYTVQIAGAGKSPNWGGANVFLSLDGNTYAQIGTIAAPSVIGMLSAPLAAGSDPDTADTLSVDLTLSPPSAELVSVTQTLADAYTTLCVIVDQTLNTFELISYENAVLTAAARYNLTYLRRGIYSSPVAAHAMGAWFAFLGPNYNFSTYTFRAALMGTPFYIKLQSFNLAGRQVENLADCTAWEFLLGYQEGARTVYTPSQVTNLQSGPLATVTNPDNALNQQSSSAAIFDSIFGTLGGANTASADYTGFPSVVLPYPATLYIGYQNLRGNGSIGGTLHFLANAEISVSLNNGSTFAVLAQSARQQLYNVSPNSKSGTLSISVPAGTNLSNIIVAVSAMSNQEGTVGTPGTGEVEGHVEILRIWLQ